MNERKILLYLLTLVLLLFGFQMYRIFVIQPIKQYDQRLEQSRQVLQRLENQQKDQVDNQPDLEEEAIGLLHSFPLEADYASFSQRVKSSVLQNGLKLHQFKQGEDAEEKWIEYNLEGSARGFFHFLDDLYSQGPLFSILRLNVTDRQGTLRISLRMAPFLCPEKFLPLRKEMPYESPYLAPVRNTLPSELYTLFPSPPPVERAFIAPSSEPSMESPSEESPALIDRQSLQYLGRIKTEEQGDQYYFKDLRTGQILALQPGVASGDWLLEKPIQFPYKVSYKQQLFEVSP